MENVSKLRTIAVAAEQGDAATDYEMSKKAYQQAARAQFAPSPELPDGILDALGELYWNERAFQPEKFR